MTTSTLYSKAPGVEVASMRASRRVSFTSLLRWFIVLAGLLALLYSSYSALVGWRNEAANAVSDPLTPDVRLGQTFVARYAELSGVELRLSKQKLSGPTSGATLVLHLRAAPGAGPDLATVTRHFDGADIEESSYYLFAFPSIHDSQGKTYYMEVTSPEGRDGDALALLWWMQFDRNLLTDPYAAGTAYLNGDTQQADIAFGLRYSASPVDVFAQLVSSLAPDFPRKLMLLLFVVAAIPLLAVLYLLRRSKYKIQDIRSKVLTWSLPIALWAALLSGVTFAWLIPPWEGPDEHGHFTYAALLDRHGLNAGEVQNIAWEEGGKDHAEVLALKSAIVASMDHYNWTRLVSGHPTPGASAFPPGSADLYNEFTWELKQPPAYYWLCAAALHVARFSGMRVDPLLDPASALRVMRLVSVLLNLLVVALAWLAGLLLSGRGYGRWRGLQLLLPLTVALLPMHTFIGSVVSNDSLSELNVAALFVALTALLRWSSGWRGACLLGLSGLLLLLSTQTKLTATVAGGPLFVLGILLWLGILLTRYITKYRTKYRVPSTEYRVGKKRIHSVLSTRYSVLGTSFLVPAIVIGGFLLVCLVGGMLVFRQNDLVAAWQSGGGPSARPERVQTASAHSGQYVMQLTPGSMAYQWLSLPWPHEAYSATLSLWARAASDSALPSGVRLGMAGLTLDQRGTLSRIGAETLSSSALTMPITATTSTGWNHFTATFFGSHADRKVWVNIWAAGAPLQLDDISLSMAAVSAAGASDSARGPTSSPPEPLQLPVFNPSAEIGSIALSPLGSRLIKGQNADTLDVLLNPQAFSKGEIWQRYAYRQFRSFWGNFGWLSIPLPDALYTLIDVILSASLAGLAIRGSCACGRWSRGDWLGLVALISLGLAIVTTFARQMGPLSTSGVHSDPQGRYLFGFTIPIVWLSLEGLRVLWSMGVRLVRNLTAQPSRSPSMPDTGPVAGANGDRLLLSWGVWLWCVGLFFFTGYCLLTLIAPYYGTGN